MGELQGRDVKADGDDITVYDLSANPNSWYSTIYQNQDTRKLDELFGLTGKAVEKGSEADYLLGLATGACSLGKTEVEMVLTYFAILARQAGNFIGLPEEQLREHIRKGDLGLLISSECLINGALNYQDGMNDGKTYLKRMEVEGVTVVFPQNLRKLIF